jgi:hypothetical protein
MYEEVITLQDPMRMSFDEFARHLQAVFDTMAKRGERSSWKKRESSSDLKQRMLHKRRISGQTMIRKRFGRA